MKIILRLTILSNLFSSCTSKGTLSPKVASNDDLQLDSNQAVLPSSNSSKGLPQNLTSLIQRIESEKFHYPERDREVESMKRSLANDEFSSVEFKAKQIMEKQHKLASAIKLKSE